MAHNTSPVPSNVAETPICGNQGRGKNFSAAEERQLCLSFLHVSQDPIIGSGQKSGKFWLRIEKHYNERRPSNADQRPARSLESKWSTIKHDMSKFVAAYEAILALNGSGVNEADRLTRSLDLYKQSHPKGHSFTFVESWKILKDIPKWNQLGDKSMKLKQTSTKACGGGILGDISNLPLPLLSKESTSPELAYASKRPLGTKAAKDFQKKTKLHDIALQEQVKASKSMAEASQLKATLNLFAMDLSIQDALGREYLQLLKQAELSKLKKQLWEMGEVEDLEPSKSFSCPGAEPSSSTTDGAADGAGGPCVATRTPLEMPNNSKSGSRDTEILQEED